MRQLLFIVDIAANAKCYEKFAAIAAEGENLGGVAAVMAGAEQTMPFFISIGSHRLTDIWYDDDGWEA